MSGKGYKNSRVCGVRISDNWIKTADSYPRFRQLGFPFGVRAELGSTEYWAVFRCFCGNAFVAGFDSVKTRAHGCGCTRKHRTAGAGTNTPEYTAWHSMKSRCYRKRYHNYNRYGARGIIVCERWLNSFADFLADVGKRPSASHSLDRIDNNGNYEPGNCRWATKKEQANNRCDNRMIDAFGEIKSAFDWSNDERCVVSQLQLVNRILSGERSELAISRSLCNNRRRLIEDFEAFGERLTIEQWADDSRCAVSKQTLKKRIRKGISPELAITTPSRKRKKLAFKD
jgi:hypothetical protein